MSFVISSVLPFPNISWWQQVLSAGEVRFDLSEHFEKMSMRNGYLLAGANGLLKLTIPLQGGRDQKAAMKDILISDHEHWQVNHWRSIYSAYKHAPYFDFYEPSLSELFRRKFERLVDFNLATIHWVKEHIGADFTEQMEESYQEEYEDASADLRRIKSADEVGESLPKYYQVFEERNGFMPNLSILDLMFAEGPYVKRCLMDAGC